MNVLNLITAQQTKGRTVEEEVCTSFFTEVKVVISHCRKTELHVKVLHPKFDFSTEVLSEKYS